MALDMISGRGCQRMIWINTVKQQKGETVAAELRKIDKYPDNNLHIRDGLSCQQLDTLIYSIKHMPDITPYK